MINWQPTSPLLSRPPAHLKTSKDLRFDDWSIAELLRGERLEPPRPNGARGRGYDPHQPRVPAGHSDGGQWTREGGVNTKRTSPGSEGGTQRGSDHTPNDTRWNAQAETFLHLLDSIDQLRLPEKANHRFHQFVEASEVKGRGQQGAQHAELRPRSAADELAVERTTEILRDILVRVNQAVSQWRDPISARLYGIAVHKRFADEVRTRNLPGIGTVGVEQTFVWRGLPRYGLDGSIRTDIVLRNADGRIIAIYDLKTGGATMRPSREEQIRKYTKVDPSVPLIILHAIRGGQ
jgi:hypothetical protein